MLGLDAPEAELAASFETAAGFDLVKGFAVGRTLFSDAAEKWLAGEIDDRTAIEDMAGRFARLTDAWQRQVLGSPPGQRFAKVIFVFQPDYRCNLDPLSTW